MAMTATVSRVGNSAAVLLPKALRQHAGISVGDAVRVSSPRQGVLVLSREEDDIGRRLQRYEEARERMRARVDQWPAWPAGMTADDLIDAAKGDRAHGSASH